MRCTPPTGTFADYLTDGKKYTVIVPDNTGIEVYYRTEGSANGNPPRLCNTLKYNIIKGKFVPEMHLRTGRRSTPFFRAIR